MTSTTFQRSMAGAAFALAAIYAARNQKVKLYKANNVWVVEVYS